MQHQFGSMVLAADAYRQELLRDATRVRPIPATNASEGLVTSVLPTSVVTQAVLILLRRPGTLLVRVGQRLKGVQPRTMERSGPTPSGEVSAIA